VGITAVATTGAHRPPGKQQKQEEEKDLITHSLSANRNYSAKFTNTKPVPNFTTGLYVVIGHTKSIIPMANMTS